MTMKDVASLERATIGTKEAAELLGTDRYTVTLLFRKKRLPVEHFFSGNRLHIVKNSLLEYLGYRQETGEAACR